MKKWRRKYEKYLKSKPKPQQPIYGEGHPCNGNYKLGSPFSYGDCVLWRSGEEARCKEKLDEGG